MNKNMIGIIIIGSLLIIFTLFLYYRKHKSQKKYFNYDDLLPLIINILTIIGIGFGAYQIIDSNINAIESNNTVKEQISALLRIDSSTQHFSNSFETLSDRMNKIPLLMDEFSSSISLLNKTINNQQQQINSNSILLSKNIDGLNNNFFQFQKKLNIYNNQLSNIVSQTDSQLVILNKNNKAISEYYSKKPKLNINIESKVVKDTIYITNIYINNTGNDFAEITECKLKIPNSLIESFENIHHFKTLLVNNNIEIYIDKFSININQVIKTPLIIKMKMSTNIDLISSSYLYIAYKGSVGVDVIKLNIYKEILDDYLNNIKT